MEILDKEIVCQKNLQLLVEVLRREVSDGHQFPRSILNRLEASESVLQTLSSADKYGLTKPQYDAVLQRYRDAEQQGYFGGGKLSAIKMIREFTGLGLAESKIVFERIESDNPGLT